MKIEINPQESSRAEAFRLWMSTVDTPQGFFNYCRMKSLIFL